ncbi:MAG: hypothetical protein ACD_15C00162G0008 [uncultured bacterium]|nr:MAG: hypothetical protein ACD_15C00162G0008 [uncultured bacterium]
MKNSLGQTSQSSLFYYIIHNKSTDMNHLIQYLSKQKTFLILLAFSFFLTINTLFFLASQGAFFHSFQNSLPRIFFYLAYFVLTSGILLLPLPQKEIFNFDFLAKSLLLIYLPSELIFIYALQGNFQFTPYVGIFVALYVAFLNFFIIRLQLKKDNLNSSSLTEKKHPVSRLALAIIFLVMLTSFSFGFFRLGKLAVVDEPLWTFDRVPNFWRDFAEMDWRNANVSDKPGQTVAAISGAGLLFEKNPKKFEDRVSTQENPNINAPRMEKFNLAFRLPIWIFVIMMAPLFFLFIRRLAGENSALLSVILIYLSPLMIGNSRIINPDSILWIFTSLSIITFLTYLKENRKAPLVLSAFFLGLGILTKYTANLLYFFFLGLVWAEYIFNFSRYAKEGFHPYFKKRFADYGLLIFISFSTFFVLYPAAWGKPMRLLNSTLLSQAMEPLWITFVSLLILLAADLIFLKSLVLGKIMNFLVRFQKWLFIFFSGIFIISVLLVFINVYGGMNMFDFQEILSSPKSSFSNVNLLDFFITNFYPLVFGVSALAILPLMFFSIVSVFQKNFPSENARNIFYLILFILVYYAGSTASQVASIIRYQIIVFPVLLIASAMAIRELVTIFNIRGEYKKFDLYEKKPYFFLFLIIILASSLWQVKPFYMGYASVLLPEKYYLDIKDMGEGSYEAAEYLNSLPDAKKLSIWTDKQGVCVFFVGKCHTKIDTDFFAETNFDYLVVSSGRKSRTTKLRGELFFKGTAIKEIYETEKYEKIIPLAGRKNNYLKIIKSHALEN